jgi:formylglycine-generating enzyme required for sulfatase activity
MSAILSRAACLSGAMVLLTSCVDWRAMAADSDESSAVDLTVSEERPAFANSVGMKFVYVKPGKFIMGTTAAEQKAVHEALKGKRSEHLGGEEPRPQVKLTKGFYVGVYEVTQKQYRAVTGANPSAFSRNGSSFQSVQTVKDEELADFPVEQVTWDDAQAFLKKLSELPAERSQRRIYRLPTEAEWEYCCRAGAEETFTFRKPSKSISAKQANFDGNFPFGGGAAGVDLKRTCKVGSYEPNPWGIYDMHGNLWEMTADWYDPNAYKEKNRVDPKGPKTGQFRVIRGGSWASNGEGCRSGFRRHDFTPETKGWNYGFRAVCEVR